MKINPIALAIILTVLATTTIVSILFAYLGFQNSKNNISNQQIPKTEAVQSTASGLPQEKSVSKGLISGQLCYPSEFIPKGTVVAKRITDQKIFTTEYAGTESGATSSYSIEVEEGDYYVRFEIEGQNYNGYHTEYNVNEGTGPHTLKEVSVKAGQNLSAIDICDFYYPQGEEPNF